MPDRLHLGRIESPPAQVLQGLQVGMAGQHVGAGRLALGTALREAPQRGCLIAVRVEAVIGQLFKLLHQPLESRSPAPGGDEPLLLVEVLQGCPVRRGQPQHRRSAVQLRLLEFQTYGFPRFGILRGGGRKRKWAGQQQNRQPRCMFFRQACHSGPSFAC
ncbi:hypothetical protein D3C75_738630 [compost metagenome]